jgi:hypothetical protein
MINTYTDVLAALGLLVFVALIVAIYSPLGLFAWIRQEWQLMRAESWEPASGTIKDPDVATMVARQKAMGARMKRQGVSLLAGKPYRPELTKPAQPAPRASAVVTPIHARGGSKR